MSRVFRVVLSLVTVFVCWIAMMAVHESGHVLAALSSGGHIQKISIPLLGFSRTDVDPNPSPRFETWSGPIFGSLLPLSIWLLFRKRLPSFVHAACGFFTGLCLIANGAYLAFGCTMNAGDAAELIKRGTPAGLLIALGIPAIVAGLYIWHTLGRINNLFTPSSRNPPSL